MSFMIDPHHTIVNSALYYGNICSEIPHVFCSKYTPFYSTILSLGLSQGYLKKWTEHFTRPD